MKKISTILMLCLLLSSNAQAFSNSSNKFRGESRTNNTSWLWYSLAIIGGGYWAKVSADEIAPNSMIFGIFIVSYGLNGLASKHEPEQAKNNSLTDEQNNNTQDSSGHSSDFISSPFIRAFVQQINQ